MTTPLPPNRDSEGFAHELLAAYADGELDAAQGAVVERWLAEHPEARADVEAQCAFSPANAALWERAEPPEPSVAAWATVRRGIEAALTPTTPASKHWRVAAWSAGGIVAASIAAAVWFAVTPTVPMPKDDTRPVDVVKNLAPIAPEIAPPPRAVALASSAPVAGFAVLPMASDDDVILDRVPDTRAGWLPVGRHPFSGTMVLASLEEVRLEDVDPSPAWPLGGPKMTTAPGDAPMIFAAKPR